jgi:DNA polymerase (family 10)
MDMNNKEISSIVGLYGKLAELHGENSFKVKSYNAAAFNIKKIPDSLSEMSESELFQVQGLGKGLVPKIFSLTQTGSFPQLDRYLEITPKGVLAMLKIKGIGAKKIAVIWREMGIDNIGELLYACKENRLKDVKGFGLKTQASVIQQIEFLFANENKFHYATVIAHAHNFLEFLRKLPGSERVEYTGELRRESEILESLDYIYNGTFPFLELDLEENISELEVSEIEIKAMLNSKYPIRIVLSNESSFISDWMRETGNEEHLSMIGFQEGTYDTEEEAYEKFNSPFIIPEIREGREIEKTVDQESLIQYTDLKGVIHNHSTYSDGLHSLKEMAEYARELGFEYLGISDHSKSAFYANGLNEQRILQQHEEIDKLNDSMGPFKIFKSIESDILNTGELDYSNEVLSSFDFVIASVHSNLKMTEEKAHNRLIKAIENPHTDILGHMTGRLLLMREGYPVNHKYIIDACAENGVCIEINANPYRLDIDWRWLEYCMEKGVVISINPDAHNKEGYLDMVFGVNVARKGLLTKEMTLNAKSLSEFEQYFKNK